MSIGRLSGFGMALAIVMAGAATSGPQTSPGGWHAPLTTSELALDRILKMADGDSAQLDNLLGGRGKARFHPTVDYKAVMTPSLLTAIKRSEDQLVQKSCGGRYTGEVCGLDFSPVTCAQDVNDTYLYRTEFKRTHVAEVSYAWPSGDASPTATYMLLEEGGIWKIDGIKCLGYAWNMR
jgi:hypothetical protein